MRNNMNLKTIVRLLINLKKIIFFKRRKLYFCINMKILKLSTISDLN